MDRSIIENHFRSIQDVVSSGLLDFDPTASRVDDVWERPGGGGGITRIIAGESIEKAAVNFSAVWGPTPAQLAELAAAGSRQFYATGVSIIVHPHNPHAPTLHANLRYFETDSDRAWFGGGCDLTPFYFYQEDAVHFHRTLKAVCDRHPVADYDEWKKACDAYFQLPHRNEARGIGGLFFDHLTDNLSDVWTMLEDLGHHLLGAYRPILDRRSSTPFTEEQEVWHQLRRGRYVEFNLVWDRGTRFGLDTGGRTESVLASLPPRARWQYDFQPLPDTPEFELLALLQGAPRDWV
ncbi:MAG TPA: oxygen-dependent coproporphyrinogen oxidase [Acidimicrobiia bacterium]|nr:oxygen-dependent coproporphyrinogen oxidase [Acidimicrobiia bacterium]